MFYGKISVVVRLVGIVVFFSVTLLDYTHIRRPSKKSGDFFSELVSILFLVRLSSRRIPPTLKILT